MLVFVYNKKIHIKIHYKLALVLSILGAAFVVSEATCLCQCQYRWVYLWVCTLYLCTTAHINRLLCTYYGCYGKRSVQPELQIGYPCHFAEYDASGNGEIDKSEFKAIVKVSNSTEVLENFQEWDKTKDGAISWREFLTSEHEFQCKPRGCERIRDEADEEFWDAE